VLKFVCQPEDSLQDTCHALMQQVMVVAVTGNGDLLCYFCNLKVNTPIHACIGSRFKVSQGTNTLGQEVPLSAASMSACSA